MRKYLYLTGIALILMVASYSTGMADRVVGSLWKQEKTIVYPADDVTKIDFSNISTVNMLGAGGLPGPADSYGFNVISGTRVKAGSVTVIDGVDEIVVIDNAGTLTFISGNNIVTTSGRFNLTAAGTQDIKLLANSGGASLILDGAASNNLMNSNINAATGNEIAYKQSYTVNKSSSGDVVGYQINATETAVPGGHKPFEILVDTVSNFSVDNKGLVAKSADTGLTADVGSIQGGLPLTANVNEISVVGTTGDSATLKAAVAGISFQQTIINNGANAMDVFPASGDNLGAGVDTAASLAAGARITYVSYDATNWIVL